MASRQEVASLIVDFLSNELKNGDIPDDNKDSIDFAIESITDVFEVDSTKAASIKEKIGNKSLSELVAAAQASQSTATPVASESVPIHIDESDEQTKEKAEALKLEGNRAMAAKDFDTAIAKYTSAIELIPANAVYLSNRAAAYSSIRKHDLALADAKKATEVEPTYAKGWSRLGLANYALGKPEESLKAYEKGLEVEGSTPSDAMKRGYETAKKKVSDSLMNSLNTSDDANLENPVTANSTSNASAGAGGMPDFSAFANMMGGGDNGGGLGGLAGLMNNPQIMQAAAQMMKDPNALNNLMNNPQVKQMANSMGLNSDSLEGLANNPMLQNMAKNFMGGNNSNTNQ